MPYIYHLYRKRGRDYSSGSCFGSIELIVYVNLYSISNSNLSSKLSFNRINLEYNNNKQYGTEAYIMYIYIRVDYIVKTDRAS